ncbi:hypothetical protein MMC16_000544 [Acarospora aff. strigata]|nr:hypothetical protein [Acarospora aff. strigata]
MVRLELPLRLGPHSTKCFRPNIRPKSIISQRTASSQAAIAESSEDVDPSSSFTTDLPPDDIVRTFNPAERSRTRKVQLPASRYRFRPPKYYRGPLHPYQPPPPSDPSSRLFIPGPFTLPRLQQTYTSTLRPDLLTLSYLHLPPGYRPPPRAPRLRIWDDSSPYHKNRPARPPRGADVLRLLKKPATFRNVPAVERITVHTMVKRAVDDSAHLHVAGMIVQAITNVRVRTHKHKKTLQQFGTRAGRYVSVTADLRGEDMYHFLGKVVDVVLPRIKDYQGVKGSSGDSSGNISFGFDKEVVGSFPEIEVNYDS